MKKQLAKLILIIFCFIGLMSKAQIGRHNFSVVENYVKSLGTLDSMTIGTISNLLTKKFNNKIDKTRAIYYWIANNIRYDVKAARANNTSKNASTDVILYRKAVGVGFANLFQDMCSIANIRCLTVNGFVKNSVEDIGEKTSDINHSWAVVQLGESPDDWYYVDPAFGSGTYDAEMKVFTPAYTAAYFFTDKETFNLQHYPDNLSWKLGSGPKSKKDFFDLPVIKNAAIEFGIKRFSPNDGNLKIKSGKQINFSFTLSNMPKITLVQLGVGQRKKYKEFAVPFTVTNEILSFSYIFPEDDNFPLTILINGKQLVSYNVDTN